MMAKNPPIEVKIIPVTMAALEPFPLAVALQIIAGIHDTTKIK